MYFANKDLQIDGKPRAVHMPVPEAASWDPYVVKQHIEQGALIDIPEDLAKDYMTKHAKEAKLDQLRVFKRRVGIALGRYQNAHKFADKARGSIHKELDREAKAWEAYQKTQDDLADFVSNYVEEKTKSVEKLKLDRAKASGNERDELQAKIDELLDEADFAATELDASGEEKKAKELEKAEVKEADKPKGHQAKKTSKAKGK